MRAMPVVSSTSVVSEDLLSNCGVDSFNKILHQHRIISSSDHINLSIDSSGSLVSSPSVSNTSNSSSSPSSIISPSLFSETVLYESDSSSLLKQDLESDECDELFDGKSL